MKGRNNGDRDLASKALASKSLVSASLTNKARGCGAALVGFGVGLAALSLSPAIAQSSPPSILPDSGVSTTGDAPSGPRTTIPWLREALEGGETSGAAAPSGDLFGGASSDEPPATDVFGGVFGSAFDGGSLSDEAQEPPTEPSDSLKKAAGVFTEPEGDGASETDAPDAGPRFGFDRRAPERGAAAAPTSVEVAPMKAVDGSAAGLISAQDAKLPADGWRAASAEESLAVLRDMNPGPYRRANLLAIQALTAGLAPPRDADGAAFLAARIDALRRFGASELAAKLAEAAGPDLIVLGADAALVSGTEAGLCTALTAAPHASLARIYCQAVSGDALAASLSIEASRALGESDETTLALLEAVAEPSYADLLGAKEKNAEPTPLRLAARRMIGLAPPADFARDASLEMLPAALYDNATPRLRLEAIERLEMSGAVDTDALAKEFDKHKSAESGGVWGRVEAYRKAQQASDSDFPAAVQAAIARAESAGRRGAAARLLAPLIAARALPVSGAAPDPGVMIAPLRAVLREGGEAVAAVAVGRAAEKIGPPAEAPDAVERALDRIAEPKWPGGWEPEHQAALQAAAQRGDRQASFVASALTLFEATPDEATQSLTSDGRAALQAMQTLARLGKLVSAQDQGAAATGLAALATFRSLGWEQEARALAVEIAASM